MLDGSAQRNNIHGISIAVDDRASGNADVAINIGATKVIGNRSPKIGVPVSHVGGIGVEGVNAVMHRRDIDHVVDAAADIDIGCHQRLAVNLVIHHVLEEHAKLVDIYVAGRKGGLVQVGAGARVVIVLGQNVY